MQPKIPKMCCLVNGHLGLYLKPPEVCFHLCCSECLGESLSTPEPWGHHAGHRGTPGRPLHCLLYLYEAQCLKPLAQKPLTDFPPRGPVL